MTRTVRPRRPQFFSYGDWVKASQRQAPAVEAAAIERDKRIVAEVNQRRLAKGQAPLAADQMAEMLGRLAAERAQRR